MGPSSEMQQLPTTAHHEEEPGRLYDSDVFTLVFMVSHVYRRISASKSVHTIYPEKLSSSKKL